MSKHSPSAGSIKSDLNSPSLPLDLKDYNGSMLSYIEKVRDLQDGNMFMQALHSWEKRTPYKLDFVFEVFLSPYRVSFYQQKFLALILETFQGYEYDESKKRNIYRNLATQLVNNAGLTDSQIEGYNASIENLNFLVASISPAVAYGGGVLNLYQIYQESESLKHHFLAMLSHCSENYLIDFFSYAQSVRADYLDATFSHIGESKRPFALADAISQAIVEGNKEKINYLKQYATSDIWEEKFPFMLGALNKRYAFAKGQELDNLIKENEGLPTPIQAANIYQCLEKIFNKIASKEKEAILDYFAFEKKVAFYKKINTSANAVDAAHAHENTHYTVPNTGKVKKIKL